MRMGCIFQKEKGDERKMNKLLGVFCVAWLLCGCSVDTMLDDWRSCVVAVVALIVCVAVAGAITGGDD